MKNDNVNRPQHYTDGEIECIDALRSMLGEDFGAFCQGTIVQYLWRYKHKNGVEDLRKAEWYLNALLKFEEDNHARTLRKIKGCNVNEEEINLNVWTEDPT
tara:strand:- start:363 stop:665 length:303 start_codon:yes stop_codon:yes gene_type:complete